MPNNHHILAVDDDPNNRMIVDEILADSYDVLSVESGEEALRVAPEFRPNLILLDVMMPGLDGNETCRQLRAIPEISRSKILMLSARNDLGSRLTAYDCGAVDYIAKPFDEAEVLAKVGAWIRMVHQEQLDEIWHDLESLPDKFGTAMTLVAAFRDNDTGDHLLRLRGYAQELADELRNSGPYRDDIDESFLRKLYRASPLHDLGKVAAPDAILKKPDRLTESEFAIIKQHTVIGYEMLKLAATQLPTANYMEMAAAIARSHHERFDGTGYPDGLAGSRIPLAARIVAVADVFDALSSTRPYKPRFPMSECMRLIEENSGTAFDPAVVAAFFRRRSAFERIHRLFSEGPRAWDPVEP